MCVFGVNRRYFCAEEHYFRRAVNGHDDENHIAELVNSVRQGHKDRNRARSVAQSVEYHLFCREHHMDLVFES